MNEFKLTEEAVMGIVQAGWDISDEVLACGLCCVEITKLWPTEASVTIGIYGVLETIVISIVDNNLHIQPFECDYWSVINISGAAKAFEKFKQKGGQQ